MALIHARQERRLPRSAPAALIGLLLGTLATAPAAAQEMPAHQERPHHLSLVLGGTHVPEAGHTGFTIGLDYEYRLNRNLGLGFIAEYAAGPVDATTFLAVADIHVAKGFALQTGPGVEIIDGETFFTVRFGALYEFELGEAFTLSPQLHYDLSAGEDGIIFAIALGRGF
jgi:hypothetical protein